MVDDHQRSDLPCAHNYIHSPVVDLVGHGRAVKECKSGEDVNSTKLTASDHYI